MSKNPHAAPELPLCKIEDVFWSECYSEPICIGADEKGFLRRIPSAYSWGALKSYSAPKPNAPGTYRLSVTTTASERYGKQRFDFPGQIEITRADHIQEPGTTAMWVTHFEHYAPPAPTVADAGRKGGKKTGRKGFAAMSKTAGKRVRKLASAARWPKH